MKRHLRNTVLPVLALVVGGAIAVPGALARHAAPPLFSWISGATSAKGLFEPERQGRSSAADAAPRKLEWVLNTPGVRIVRSQTPAFRSITSVSGNDGALHTLVASTACPSWTAVTFVESMPPDFGTARIVTFHANGSDR
jgi:hypothetical protein